MFKNLLNTQLLCRDYWVFVLLPLTHIESSQCCVHIFVYKQSNQAFTISTIVQRQNNKNKPNNNETEFNTTQAHDHHHF